ncbi:MAG: pyridoxamine 5'-phosphate oxidase [Sphingomonadales bacterium]|nr:pyridoxamine 5'-phosphate oxidase [Sphingomonadales bacterium]
MKSTAYQEPFDIFGRWFEDAKKKELNDPDAMALVTATADGVPSVRMVLLKAWDEKGFVFYTNMESHKGRELIENPHVSLLFHWKSLRKQVRVYGKVERVSEQESDDYFTSRPRDSRIGAWASKQSRPMEGRFEFEKAIVKETARFGVGDIPRPDYWYGSRVIPTAFEFWEDRPFRLHDRQHYTLQKDGNWALEVLYP